MATHSHNIGMRQEKQVSTNAVIVIETPRASRGWCPYFILWGPAPPGILLWVMSISSPHVHTEATWVLSAACSEVWQTHCLKVESSISLDNPRKRCKIERFSSACHCLQRQQQALQHARRREVSRGCPLILHGWVVRFKLHTVLDLPRRLVKERNRRWALCKQPAWT